MGFFDKLKNALGDAFEEAADVINKTVDTVEKPLTDKATDIAKNASGYASEAADAITKAVDKVEKPLTDKATEFANDVTKEVKNQVGSIQSTPQAPVQTVECDDYIDYSNNYNTGEEYFDTIINNANFPEYEIVKNIHPSTLDGNAHPSCYNISYMFYQDGEAVLAVLLMNTNQYRSMCANGTYEVLDDNGISYIRFFKGMKNEQFYVINRIKDNL